ncbi:MAG: glycine C-acetyltransferase [Deltaproteobacteria bacterium]|nr:glycine C-acetyltransferase [Deltaproteobacteria bacterium]
MFDAAKPYFEKILGEIDAAGLTKTERLIESPQGPEIVARPGGRVINLCANNYLGLANHPRVIEAAQRALLDFGYGLSSVRFICGTQTIHKDLEQRISAFLGTEDTILYSSCFDANGGLFETLLTDEDAIISDALNHASIIDGIRLSKAARFRFASQDMNDLEAQLKKTASHRLRMIATDGVFSMDGAFAKLSDICDLAEKYGAMVMVDDSHATGFVGPTGRGTPELFGVAHRIDVLTSTLGKALGGAAGGFTTGKKAIVELLRQRSRPYLFSNTLSPVISGASLEVLSILEESADLRAKLFENTRHFRTRMTEAGFDIRPGTHPIVPVMFHDARRAKTVADDLLAEGVYVVGFWYPVVPESQARIRVQISAVHDIPTLDRAIEAFSKVAPASGHTSVSAVTRKISS